MKVNKLDLLYLSLIFFISLVLVSGLFISPGRPTSYDANIHITTISQFYLALKDGDFPVLWTTGFANYGYPLGLVGHQLTNYIGATLMFRLTNPELIFNLLMFIGVLLSCIFFYLFLRIYFARSPSFLGVFLFNFAPYRIHNLYVRGDLPEIFSAIFLPLILISLYFLIRKKCFNYFFLLVASTFLLILTHPMMAFIYSFMFLPYALFLWLKRPKTKILLIVFLGIAIGFGLASYYILPLMLELKYFYIGQYGHQAVNSFLSFSSFFGLNWNYFSSSSIMTRGDSLQTGILESCSIIVASIYFLKKLFKAKIKNLTFVDFSALCGVFILFFTIKPSAILYSLPLLKEIQFPWRMLSIFIFIPPIIYAGFFNKKKEIFAILFLSCVSFLYFPQIYGKNNSIVQENQYFFTTKNLHGLQMNTVWSGKTETYPQKTEKISIIEGSGSIASTNVRNSSREYKINADTTVKLVDYTFYFPGWTLYVDGTKSAIEYQDPAERGVITYILSPGSHKVDLKFEDTKVRLLGKYLSLFFMMIIAVVFVLRKKVSKILA